MLRSNDHMTLLNSSISQLGAAISRMDKGMVVRQIGERVFNIPVDFSANVDPASLQPVNAVWFPRFRSFFLGHINGLGVSSSLRDITAPEYVGKINDLIKQLKVAHKYYCVQTQNGQPAVRFIALVKKQITAEFINDVTAAFENTVKQMGGAQSIKMIQQPVDAATFSSGIENYNWQGQAITNVHLFAIPKSQNGISVSAHQPTGAGMIRAEDPAVLMTGKPVQTLNPGPPQKKEDFIEPVKQTLTPTAAPEKGAVESIKESAEKEVTMKNKNLWLWIAAALGAGYILKR